MTFEVKQRKRRSHQSIPLRRFLFGQTLKRLCIRLFGNLSFCHAKSGMIVERRAAGRAVLGSFVFVGAAILLWTIAVVAYVIFYLSYIPVRGFTLPLYLQFQQERSLFASVSLPSGRLVSDQPYDIKLHLHLPRTLDNTAAGNFMLNLQLQKTQTSSWTKASDSSEVIAAESRPAILTYYSPLIEHVHNFVALPLYVVGWRKESENLDVPLMEGVTFARGWQNIPTQARVEIDSINRLQIYDAKISFKARLKGLRYLMYNFRISSFIVFTSLFWFVEMLFTAAAWAILTFVLPERSHVIIKSEEDDEPSVKDERETLGLIKKEEEVEGPSVHDYPPAAEADDEDDETPGHSIIGSGNLRVSDSGLGTSLESSSSRPDPLRRRQKTSFENLQPAGD